MYSKYNGRTCSGGSLSLEFELLELLHEVEEFCCLKLHCTTLDNAIEVKF